MRWLRHAIPIAIFGAVAYYEHRRLVRATRLRGRARVAATLGITALVAPIVVVSLRSGGPPTIRGFVAWPVYLGWAGFALLFVGLVATDAGRLVVWMGRRAARRPAMDLARRAAIARITGGAVVSLVALELGAGLADALAPVPVVDVPVRLRRLAPALDGFTLLQLTDLHAGGTIDRARVAALVERANAARPDAFVLTGDLVDGTVAELAHVLEPLGELRAPHGAYFVTGNHEYYFGVEDWLAYLAERGIRVLRNERVVLARGAAAFDLAGIDDHSAAGYGRGHGADLSAALAGRDPSRPVVLLAHQPRQVHDAARAGVDLVLSGHTHGGQVWPWHYLASVQQGGLLAGRYRLGATVLYVSRGAGYWGPPVRVGAPAELTRIILRA